MAPDMRSWKVDNSSPVVTAGDKEPVVSPTNPHEVLTSKTAATWSDFRLPELGPGRSPRNWIGSKLFVEALMEKGPTVHEISVGGNLASSLDTIRTQMQTIFKVRPIYETHGNYMDVLYSGEDVMLAISSNYSGTNCSIDLVTTDLSKVQTLQKLVPALFAPENPRDGFIYALGKGPWEGTT